MIQTKHLTKIYKNGFKAVDNLELHVSEGDIFGYLGPNGAGKTTTIRMLDGLLMPTEGKALIDGMDIVEHQQEIRKVIGVVPESHGYYYSMTAKEYLEYFSSLFEPDKNQEEYIEYLLKKVGLYEKRNVAVGQFSRGMKQRLGIAKSLINHPKIIFLDEPTLGLDPRGQHEIQQLLLEINKSEKITIFITSHQLKDIEVMCNKVCIVQDGRLVAQGSIPQLQDRYLVHPTIYLKTGDNQRTKELLQTVNGIRSIAEMEDKSLEVKLLKGMDEEEVYDRKAKIFQTILQTGITVEEMKTKRLSMEEIFFRATAKEAANE